MNKTLIHDENVVCVCVSVCYKYLFINIDYCSLFCIYLPIYKALIRDENFGLLTSFLSRWPLQLR